MDHRLRDELVIVRVAGSDFCAHLVKMPGMTVREMLVSAGVLNEKAPKLDRIHAFGCKDKPGLWVDLICRDDEEAPDHDLMAALLDLLWLYCSKDLGTRTGFFKKIIESFSAMDDRHFSALLNSLTLKRKTIKALAA
ncbi:hypothetical protein HGA34_02410 [Candidatus Falkowbacteria bacterium]|nr:hypothetical protein [Candidatus Falkowbacteria bacterium]